MNDLSPDKRRELLDRLTLDRDDEEPRGGALLGGAIGLALGAALAGGTAWYLWPAAAPTAPTTVAAAPAEAPAAAASPRPASVLTASGYVTARRLATVSSEITGKIAEVLVEEGMSVEAGQVLARLDTTLADFDVAVAEASARAAAATAEAAAADLARLRGLPRGGVVSESALTEAEARARSTRAQAELAQAEAERAKAVRAKYEIRAPFAGVVTAKDAQPGEIVSPAAAGGGSTRTGIVTIVDMSSLEIEVDVGESFIARVRPGQRVEATLDAYPDWRIPASVAAIIPTADRGKATVKVRVAIEARDPRVLPDMAAKTLFLDGETN